MKEKLSCKFNKHLINRYHNIVTVSEIVRLYINDTEDIKTMRRAVKVDALPDGWKYHFLEQIE
ncbi:MAG TPA: 3-alpha domain-containing protein [Nitrososphaeraceae archaeon]|nr:3-alpha domain-containing protein [Nitrososphaeraceae archaeon]